VGFHSVLIGSREFLTLRWNTLDKAPRLGAMRRWVYLAAMAL
jgi:hypothetical protein